MQLIKRLSHVLVIFLMAAGITASAGEPDRGSTTLKRENSTGSVRQQSVTVQPNSGSSRGPAAAPPGTQARQQTPRSAAELNRTPIRGQFQNTQARLHAALVAVEQSEQSLKLAVNAMSSYLDREAACMGKTWSAGDMEQGCKSEDTLKLCKEKLVAACATGRGAGKGKLWANVKGAAADLGQKAQAVNGAYSESIDNLYFPGLDLSYP